MGSGAETVEKSIALTFAGGIIVLLGICVAFFCQRRVPEIHHRLDEDELRFQRTLSNRSSSSPVRSRRRNTSLRESENVETTNVLGGEGGAALDDEPWLNLDDDDEYNLSAVELHQLSVLGAKINEGEASENVGVDLEEDLLADSDV